MASRCLLHQKNLDKFAEWLCDRGWEIRNPKGDFEVLRAINKKGKWLIVYKKIDAKEHYTVRDVDRHIVWGFINNGK